MNIPRVNSGAHWYYETGITCQSIQERRTSIHGGLEPNSAGRYQLAKPGQITVGSTANPGHLNLHPRYHPSFHTVWMV